MADDHIRIETSFAKLDAAVQQAVRALEEEVLQLRAQGDTVRAKIVESRLQGIKATGVTSTGEIEAATTAVEKQASALDRLRLVQQKTLETDIARTQALREEAVAQADLAAAQRAAAGSGLRGADPAAAAALRGAAPAATGARGADVAAEQALVEAERLAAQEARAIVAAKQEAIDRTAAESGALARNVQLQREQLALDNERLAKLAQEEAYVRAITSQTQRSYAAGQAAAQAGGLVPESARKTLMAGPKDAPWSKSASDLQRYNIALGEYEAFAARADLQTNALSNSLIRQGIAEKEASNSLRQHGALTTEYLSALARGETTIAEFGYQLGATIGKFGGWAAAAAATYAALGSVVEFGKGAIDASSGVQQLNRTIDGLDPNKANQAIQALSKETNVPIKEAADAVFQYSRTFHDLNGATAAARNGLAVFKLDNVSLADSMRLSTSIFQQFGLNAQQQAPLWNMLAAGQREYNGRISETVPLLRASTGAVKNAGGDLAQLAQLSILATRIYPGIPGQIGTAFARGAATYTPKNIQALQDQFGLGKDEGNWTQLLIDAIKKSATLSGPQRRDLAGLIFDPRYGSRISGLFGPQAAQTLATIQGSGPTAITPQKTQGALQTELDRQLGTARETLHSFINALQRLGAAFGDTHALLAFGIALKGVVGAFDGLRAVINIFNDLPGPVKSAVSSLVELRLAMLFLSRTRIGGSLASATGIGNIPGFGTSEATRARQSLQLGLSSALQAYQQDIAQSTTQAGTNAKQQVTLKAQQAQLEKEVTRAGTATAAQLEEQNALSARILTLQTEQAAIQSRLNAQIAARGDLQKQYVGVTAVNRNVRFSDSKVLAMEQAVNAGTVGAEADAAATERAAAATAASGSATGRLAAAKSRLTSVFRRDAVVTAEVGAATAAAATAAAANTTAADVAAAESTATTGRLTKMAAGLGGLAAAMDPLLIALIGLPLVYQSIKSEFDKVDKANAAATKALDGPVASLAQLQQHVKDLQSAAKKQDQGAFSGGVLGTLQHGFASGVDFVSSLLGGGISGTGGKGGDATRDQATQLKAISDLYAHSITAFQSDATALVKTEAGRKELYAASQAMKQRVGSVLQSSGLPKNLVGEIYQAFIDDLQRTYADSIKSAPILKNDPFAFVENLKNKDIDKAVQTYSDIGKIFGQGNDGIKRAALAYAFLASKLSGSTNDADLQLLSSAQSNFIGAVNKQVTDLLKAAQSGQTFDAQSGDLSQAFGAIENARRLEQQALDAIIKRDKGNAAAIAKDRAAAAQIFAQMNDQLKSVIDQQLALIKVQADVSVSQIGGISPEAAIQRLQAGLSGLQQQLALAQREHASYQITGALIAQINNASQQIIQANVQNADAIAKAQESVGLAQITGTGPSADIARAHKVVENARADLARDQASGKGQAQILTDQAALDTALNALNNQQESINQQLHQSLAAYLQSKTALSISQTTDPVKQAQEQLQGDIALLATIQRQDFKSEQDFLTARNNQQAKVNKDRQGLNDAHLQAELATLAFERHLNQIGDQQYIKGLQDLLKNKQLTLAERRQIETQIYDLKQGLGKQLDLNVGNIKLPSIYQIRRAIGLGQRGELPGAQNTIINHSASVVVYVRGAGDAAAVGRVLDDHLNTSVQSAMRASGVI